MFNSDIDDLILWMDDDLIAINKPAGLLSLPDGYKGLSPHLLSVLEPRFGKLWIVHRLDKETSGVMIVARSSAAHHHLNDQFASRDVRKIYHAIVIGAPMWDELTIEAPLRKNGDRSHRTVIDHQHGKPASTSVKVLERFEYAALVQASPHTGYTHQIRAHLAWVGLPLISDPLYRAQDVPPAVQPVQQKTASPFGDAVLPIQRVALHASQITFHHPSSGEEMMFSAPYPADFSSTLEALRATCS